MSSSIELPWEEIAPEIANIVFGHVAQSLAALYGHLGLWTASPQRTASPWPEALSRLTLVLEQPSLCTLEWHVHVLPDGPSPADAHRALQQGATAASSAWSALTHDWNLPLPPSGSAAYHSELRLGSDKRLVGHLRFIPSAVAVR